MINSSSLRIVNVHRNMTSSYESMAIFSLVILSYFSLVQLLLCEGSSSGTSSDTTTTTTTTTTTSTLITLDLIHRDSRNSPLYNSSETPIERLHNSIQRSFARAASNHYNNFKTSYSRISTPVSPVPPHNIDYSNITSIVSPDLNEYLMKLSVGTPPLQIFAIADTGSNLIWTQCKPCHVCYNQTLPIFNPADSTTYKDLLCASQQCQALLVSSGGRYFCEADHLENSRCSYSITYTDDSLTTGYLALETLTFDSTSGTPVALPGVSFGCGHNNRDNEESWNGLVGLGSGPLSLISQLGSAIDWKFSYCLVPQYSYDIGIEANRSKLHFGSVADHDVTGQGVVSTPMVPMPKFGNTVYSVSLEGVSVGGNRIDVTPSNSSSAAHEGHDIIIIDPGTTSTFLPPDLYKEVEQELRTAVKAESVWPPSEYLSLCYDASDALKIPNITFHFTGADVELPPLNTFTQIPTYDEGQILCFTFYPNDGLSIFGNIAQANFLIEFDVKKCIVKFKKMDCTRPL